MLTDSLLDSPDHASHETWRKGRLQEASGEELTREGREQPIKRCMKESNSPFKTSFMPISPVPSLSPPPSPSSCWGVLVVVARARCSRRLRSLYALSRSCGCVCVASVDRRSTFALALVSLSCSLFCIDCYSDMVHIYSNHHSPSRAA